MLHSDEETNKKTYPLPAFSLELLIHSHLAFYPSLSKFVSCYYPEPLVLDYQIRLTLQHLT